MSSGGKTKCTRSYAATHFPTSEIFRGRPSALNERVEAFRAEHNTIPPSGRVGFLSWAAAASILLGVQPMARVEQYPMVQVHTLSRHTFANEPMQSRSVCSPPPTGNRLAFSPALALTRSACSPEPTENRSAGRPGPAATLAQLPSPNPKQGLRLL